MALGRSAFSKKSMAELKTIYLKLLDLKFKASKECLEIDPEEDGPEEH